jgi:hypothetical protein
MENDKSQREKTIAVLSVGLLVVAVCLILFIAIGTIVTKGDFETAITEMTEKDQELPLVTKLLVTSISNVTFGIIFMVLILVLILKELFFRSKRITLTVNIVTAISAIAYIPIYIIAVFLPMIEIIAQLKNN